MLDAKAILYLIFSGVCFHIANEGPLWAIPFMFAAVIGILIVEFWVRRDRLDS